MISNSTSLKRQEGAVLVLVALSLIMLMGVAALAIDLSHAYTDKTRLQNMADALALSAAISLNKQEFSNAIPDKEAFAENYAKTTTLPSFAGIPSASTPGNADLQTIVNNANAYLTFSFAQNYSATEGNWHPANDINGAKFARVTVAPMGIATWFAGVMGFNTMDVSASAVAGTSPINPCNNVLPIMMCADTSPLDKNCNDNTITKYGNTNNDCYGYELNVVYETKESKWQNNSIGPGNFGYFDVGSGGSAIKDCLAGDPECTSNLCSVIANSSTLISKPGNTVGPGEQGLNTRFDDYKGSIKYSDCTANYPNYCPDSLVKNSLGVTLSNTPRTVGDEFKSANNYTVPPSANPSAQIYNYYYKDNYLTTSGDLGNSHSFSPGRRLVAMPFVQCTNDGNGQTPMPLVGIGCWFLTYTTNGKIIYTEFLGTKGCNVSGTPTSTNNFGFYKIQLYKDPFAGQS